MLGNDLLKWQKVVNSFKLRVLISLSKKESDAELNVKGKFAAMLANPSKYPLMTGLSDNLSFVYNGTTNLYPTNPGNKGFDKNRYNMAATYVGLLTSLRDPRVFVVANPSKKKLADGVAANSFSAFVGASSGESLDNMSTNAQLGVYSYANQKRYYGSFTGPEPAVMIGFWNSASALRKVLTAAGHPEMLRRTITLESLHQWNFMVLKKARLFRLRSQIMMLWLDRIRQVLRPI